MKTLHVVCFFLITNSNLVIFTSAEIPGTGKRAVSAVLARQGDINIGMIAGFTQYDKSIRQCGSLLNYFGCELVEMPIYAIDQINSRTDILPNITLGIVLVDGCFNDMQSLEVSTYLLKNDNTCSDSTDQPFNKTSVSQQNTFSDELRHYDVVAIVGPWSSRIASAVSSLIGVFKIPTMGLYATSDELSDKSRYEYFLRLLAADSHQVYAILGIAKYFGWTYLSLIYAEGSYGENAFKQIDRILHESNAYYNICIAVALKISTTADDDEFNTHADALIRNENARVVIVYVDENSQVQSLLTAVYSRRNVGTFIWIGGDSAVGWEFESASLRNLIEGTLFLDHPAFPMPEYMDHLNMVTPTMRQGNTWMLKLWENNYQCTFSMNTSHRNSCSMNITLNSTMCPMVDSAINRIHDAFLVYAYALHDHIVNDCPDAFRDKTILRICIRGDALLQRIKTTTFNGVLGRIAFNENGDFMENLLVRQYYLAEDNLCSSKVVGFWDSTEMRLFINDSNVNWTTFNKEAPFEDKSKPPVSVCSQPCLDKQYILGQSLPCCWTCGDCRDNEIISPNRTGCQSCPIYTWPDEETITACVPIDPVYLHSSHIVSISLFCLTIFVGLFAVICACVFLAKRKNKLVKALSIQLSMMILVGILVVCATLVVFIVPPNTTKWICVARSAGCHFGMTMIYAPLLVKNVRIYRIFASGRKSIRAPRWVSAKSQIVFACILYLIQIILVTASECVATSEASLTMPSIFQKYVELYCFKSTTWFLVPLSYNLLIMILCAWIGFITRKLPNNFNESWFIFISVATTLFSWVVFIPAYFTISHVYLQSAILGFSLILKSLITLVCQYLPVLYAIAFVPAEKVITFSPAGPNAVNTITPIG